MVHKLLFALLLMLVGALPAAGANEYFVSLDGDDQAHDGLSRDRAFATIQHGLDALEPGDTLTIAPGEYRQAARREGLGSAEVETRIRAEIPGTVVLRGDVPAPEFQPVERYPFVYAADFDPDAEVQVVNERDTMHILQGRPNLREVSFTPGTFYHDREADRLYVSPSDGQEPDAHHYTVSLGDRNGLELIDPQRVVIEGLAVTGFNTTRIQSGGHGIRLENARDCVVRDCHVWINGFGILVNSSAAGSGRNVIERCVAWGNRSPMANWRKGAISAHRHRGDVIRDSTAFLNRQGVYLRSGSDPEEPSRLVDNLTWGNRWDAIIKGNSDHVHVTEGSIGGAYTTWSERPARNNPVRSLVFSGTGPDPDGERGNIWIAHEDDLDLYREFADPDNRDYRLQSTSRFRGTGPDGSDRGPFPYQANVYFVTPDGDDSADGLSVDAAWTTIGRAIAALDAGDTLYLEPGVYRENDIALDEARGEPGEPISIRGRGLDPVVIAGDLRVTDSTHVEFKRVRFEGVVELNNSASIAFKHCEFTGAGTALEAVRVSGLKLMHNRFEGFSTAAVALHDSDQAHLSGNLYDNHDGVALRADTAEAILYSDYNAYRNASAIWDLSGEVITLDELEGQAERYSQSFGTASDEGKLSSEDRLLLATRGPMGNPFGPFRHEPPQVEHRLVSEPEVHSVSATTANIEWRSLLPSRVHLAWGETPALENTDVFEVDSLGSYSLTGLEPGRTYYFQIKALDESQRPVGGHDLSRTATLKTIGGEIQSDMISFTTPSEDPEPATYYVATDGSDDNTGLDRDNAWRTVQHAADQVNVGDTVLLAGGTYHEQVRVRASGAPGAPITFRSMPGEKVVFSGAGLSDAFAIAGKQRLRFDGMYFLSMRFNVYKSRDIEISRVFAGRYDSAYPPEGVLLHAQDSEDLLIRNSVALSGKSGPRFRNCSNVRLEHCVFFRNMIRQLLFYPHATDAPVTLANNIFTDGLRSKSSVEMVGVISGDLPTLDERNNCFFPRSGLWEEKAVMRFNWERQLTLEQMRSTLGETSSLIANPQFRGAADISEEREVYSVDHINRRGVIPFNEFFATNPELVERGIGLQPEAFADFHFNH